MQPALYPERRSVDQVMLESIRPAMQVHCGRRDYPTACQTLDNLRRTLQCALQGFPTKASSVPQH